MNFGLSIPFKIPIFNFEIGSHLAWAADMFGGPKAPVDTPDLKPLHAKIRQLTLENDFLEGGSPRQAC